MCEKRTNLLCVKKCYSWKQWCANKRAWKEVMCNN